MTNLEMTKKFAQLTYDKYGSYSYTAGYLQTLVLQLLDGMNPKDAERQLLNTIVELQRELEIQNVNSN